MMDEQEGMRCITLMQPVYERCRELCELADSNPDYRLAVVDAQIFYPADHAASSLASLLHRNGWYRVVKMEGE